MSDNSNSSISSTTKYMLTTADNPFSPFDQFDDWFNYDVEHGYNSCGLLARIAKTSDELSETDQMLALEIAIDDIVSMHGYGFYKKVKPDDYKKRH